MFMAPRLGLLQALHLALHRRGKLGSRVARPQRPEQVRPELPHFPQLSSRATSPHGALIHSFVANVTGHTKPDISLADIPLTNIASTVPGPLNVQYYIPITAPNTSAVGAGGGPVFLGSGLDTNITAPSRVNLTAQDKTVPRLGPRVAASSCNWSSSGGR